MLVAAFPCTRRVLRAVFFRCARATRIRFVVRWAYTMSDLGLTLVGIPIGILLIAGMVGTLFLFVH
jgi:hypothetical protein